MDLHNKTHCDILNLKGALLMQQKKRHHYVPALLGRRFLLNPEDKTFYYYDADERTIKPCSPIDAFRIKDFHTLEIEGGEKDRNTIEDLFGTIEGAGASAVSLFTSGKTLPENIRHDLAAFCALQILRTPNARSQTEKMLLETLKNSAFVLDKQGVFGEPPEALKKYGSTMSDLLKSGHVNFEITLPQVTMSGLSALPEISNLISRMNWCLLTAEDTDYFLLSDNPCSVAHAEPPTQSGLGLGLPTAEMAFPIGKSHCLVTAWKDIPAKKDATRKVVNNINIKSAIFGDRFFAFPVKSKKISTLIHTYRSLNSSVEFQTFPWNAGYLQIGQKKVSGEKHYLLASALKPIFV